MPSIIVRWGKEKLDVDANTDEPPSVLKFQLFSLTGVPPDRQKLIIKGRTVGDASWDSITLAPKQVCMLMGSAEAIPTKPTEVFTAGGDENGDAESSRLVLPAGYKNLGNTCYLASVLQCFNSVGELRDALNLCSIQQPSTAEEQMTLAVKRTLADQDRVKNTESPVLPLAMLTTLHKVLPQFSSRTPTGEMEQQDANEAFTQILHLVLNHLAKQKLEKNGKPFPIRNYFLGRFDVRLKNLEADDEPEQLISEEYSPLQLSCFISQEIRYLQSGIKEKLTEEIEKRSEKLDRNAKYQKKSQISRLPAYVSCQVVRFQYKNNAQSAKILKDVKFPINLDLFDICTPELQAKLQPQRDAFKVYEDENVERLRRAKLGGSTSTKESVGNALPFSFPDDEGSNSSGFYELLAVVTHKGRSMNGGHYTAWVKLNDKDWAWADDDNISVVTEEQVLKLSGGGDWHCSYILIYGPRRMYQREPLTTPPTAAAAAAEGASADSAMEGVSSVKE